MPNQQGRILIRYGEIGLKGGNRPFFEQLLVQRIHDVTRDLAGVRRPERVRGRLILTWNAEADLEQLAHRLQHVFGIVSFSPARELEPNLEAITDAAVTAAGKWLKRHRSEAETVPFKVDARRADKEFPVTSMEINQHVGQVLLDTYPQLVVRLDDPELTVSVEVREHAYVYTGDLAGPGGLPVGSGGRAVLLLSGGIDSPLAGYLAMKRGVRLEAVHFDSFPYTSERAREKVLDLGRVLARWSGGSIKLHLVPFAECQTALQEAVPDRFLTIMMRRMMMRISERLARRGSGGALVTGESLGQVASQTLESLTVTNEVVSLPVLRPLIGWDKDEITQAARRLGTFDISVRPYEDCCGLFVPDRPVTRPHPKEVLDAEANLAVDLLAEAAVAAVERRTIEADWGPARVLEQLMPGPLHRAGA